MDQSLDQFIKDRKIKFPGRGRGGMNRGRGMMNRGRGFNRGRGQVFKGAQGNRGFSRQFVRSFRPNRGAMRGFNMNQGFNARGQMRRMSRGQFVNRNFGMRGFQGAGFRRQAFTQQRGFGFRRQNFGGRQQFSNNNLGIRRGSGIVKRGFNAQAPLGASLTKLYISNLDYGVSNQDIKELFSEFGPIRRFGVNFGQAGQSLGTAEVHYLNRASAMKAINKYNNVPLDGRPMKLETVGGQEVKVAPAPKRVGGGIGKKLVQRSRQMLMGKARRGALNQNQALRGTGIRGRGAKRGMNAKGRGGKKASPPNQAQLDAELEAYAAQKD